MNLDELRDKRATDMLALLDKQRPELVDPLSAELRAASARELEWLAPEVDLRFAKAIHRTAALHSSVAVVSPFTPSVLLLTYRVLYYVASGATPPAGIARDVYVVYGEPLATILPETRGLSRDL
jgi:hypothetical protein